MVRRALFMIWLARRDGQAEEMAAVIETRDLLKPAMARFQFRGQSPSPIPRWKRLRRFPELPRVLRKHGRFQGIYPPNATSSNPFSAGNVSTICRRNAGVGRILLRINTSLVSQQRVSHGFVPPL